AGNDLKGRTDAVAQIILFGLVLVSLAYSFHVVLRVRRIYVARYTGPTDWWLLRNSPWLSILTGAMTLVLLWLALRAPQGRLPHTWGGVQTLHFACDVGLILAIAALCQLVWAATPRHADRWMLINIPLGLSYLFIVASIPVLIFMHSMGIGP